MALGDRPPDAASPAPPDSTSSPVLASVPAVTPGPAPAPPPERPVQRRRRAPRPGPRRKPPVIIGSCVDCLHWGPLLCRGRCSPCDGFNRSHPAGDCVGCGRRAVAVSKQHCRGCWKHAAFLAGPLNTGVLFQPETTFDHQQLQFGGMRFSTPGTRRPRPTRPSVPQTALQMPQQMARQAAPGEASAAPRSAKEVSPDQLELPFSAADRQVLECSRRWALQPARLRAPRLRHETPPHLRRVLDLLAAHAAAHGWQDDLHRRAITTVRVAFAGAPPGHRTTVSELQDAGGPASLLRPVLTEFGLLDQPTPRSLDHLIAQRTTGLPESMRADVAAWIAHLHQGGPRSKAKTWKTVREYSRWVQPLLQSWAHHYEYLRELTAADIRRGLSGLPTHRQACAYVGVRSLFGFCHRDRRLFANPTARMRWGARPRPQLLPLTEADYQRVAAHARTPIQRAVLILASVHGLRPHAIRHLRLDDVDLGGAQLHLPSTLTSPEPPPAPSSRSGLRQPLGPISLDALGAWLRERHRRWPLSANPHLLVTDFSAPTTAVMSVYTLRQMFVGSGVTLDRLRRDRFLEEALTYGPDPLHLAAVFGSCPATAVEYSEHAKRLLSPDRW